MSGPVRRCVGCGRSVPQRDLQRFTALDGELVPGAELWPRFVQNRSEQFEARVCLVEVMDSPSILLRGMRGSRLPIAVAHGEGRAEFATDAARTALDASGLVGARYVDHFGKVTDHYPENPNG